MASMRITSFIRFGFMVIGVTGAASGIRYIHKIYFSDARDKNKHLVYLAAIALSSEVVKRTLSDSDFRRTSSQFGMKLLLHKDTLEALKAFAITEFTHDTSTRGSLRSFVINDIIRDPWVKEELIDLVKDVATDVKEDPEISRNRFLSCLRECTIASLHSPSLESDLKMKLTRASWEALIGPPPIGTEYIHF
ncbi:unnamed protein product [Phytomonas sp. Hart1]|nr:unnamed protein product [Phytomonas sp. Hart1]|eukprot:CCW68143.1 unnamed protein product [Phytomonas sp. isolate Hart1]